MPKKDEPEFTVTDRRRFSSEGETRPEEQTNEAPPREEKPVAGSAPALQPAAGPGQEIAPEPPPPPAPSAAERAEGSRAYKESTEALDEQLRKELGAQTVGDEFKVSFERLLEPFYVTAMMQLGLMGQEGTQRRVDIIGARQSIDLLAFLQEKTKGNLKPAETELLETIMYQLRMQYLEITNALARAVQNPPASEPKR